MTDLKFRVWSNEEKEFLSGWKASQLVIRPLSGKVTDGATTPDVIKCQYVGLKDINEVEIFEDDIVEIYGHMLVVHKGLHSYDTRDLLVGGLDRRVYGYYLESPCGSWQLNIAVELDKLKVVGNIYENQYLITK